VRREGSRRQGSPLIPAALTIALTVPLWGPIAPTAEAQPTATTSHDEVRIPGLTDPPWRAWRTDTLDDHGTSIATETATDEQDRIWVAYDDEPNVQLGLMYRDAAGWHQPDAPEDATGIVRDLVIGPHSQAWSIWATPECGTCLSVYDPDTDTWTRIDAPFGHTDARMAFGPEGNILHIVHGTYEAGQKVYRHATYEPATDTWTETTITKHGLDWLDMTVGPEGRIHAAWTLNNYASTYAIQHPNGTWETQRTESCRDHALATTPDGTLHWVCNHEQGILYQTRTTEGQWSREIALDGSELVPPRHGNDIGYDMDIDVDNRGRPHIAFATQINPFNPDDPTRPALPVYAVNLADGWHSQAVDREGTWAGDDTSLALDEEGRPHVGYVHERHAWAPSCAEAFNDCDQLRYAEPFAATAAWAADSATSTGQLDDPARPG